MRATLVLCLCNLGLVTRTSRIRSKVDHAPLSVSLRSRACKRIPEPLVRGFPDRGKPGRRDRNDRDSHVTSNSVRMQMLGLWVEGWAARAQGLQMQLLRSAALHAAAATSPLTRAPTTGLMVDSWCLCCVAEDPRRLHYSNPPECRLLVVSQWHGGHLLWLAAGSSCSVEAWCAADAWAFDGALSRPVRGHV